MIYKRILIISGFSLSSNSATDITLRSYFDHWESEKLLLLTTSRLTNPLIRTINLNSAFMWYLRNFSQRVLLNLSKKRSNRNIIPGSIIRRKDARLGLNEILFSIGTAYIDILSFRVSKRIKNEISEFNPDVIYSTLGNTKLIRLCLFFSRLNNIPILPHFMDDWVYSIYTGNIFLRIPRKCLLNEFNKLMKKSKKGFCISQKMCIVYQKRYSIEFRPLMNIVNGKIFENINYQKKEKNEIIFSYFGGLHLNRWRSLKKFAVVLKSLEEDSENKLFLDIYTNEEDRNNFIPEINSNNVRFFDELIHKQALLKMAYSDFLIHVESFDDYAIKYTKLSISTKITEYLLSGVVIIAFGPPNVASIEYLNENDCAYIISELEEDYIKKTIISALSGINKKRLINNARKLAITLHGEKQLENFISFIQSA
jgi:hypothetical protein